MWVVGLSFCILSFVCVVKDNMLAFCGELMWLFLCYFCVACFAVCVIMCICQDSTRCE